MGHGPLFIGKNKFSVHTWYIFVHQLIIIFIAPSNVVINIANTSDVCNEPYHLIFMPFFLLLHLASLVNIDTVCRQRVERFKLVAKHVATAAALKCQPNKQLQHTPSIKINWSYRRMYRTQTLIFFTIKNKMKHTTHTSSVQKQM